METKSEKGTQTPGEALWAALKPQDDDAFQEALDTGVFVDTIGAKGKTPLMEVSESGPTSTAQKLADRGANVNARDRNGETPTMYAARAGRLDNVKFLISRGADVNIRNKDGLTALDLAGEMEEWAVVDYLEAISASTAASGDPDASANADQTSAETDEPAEGLESPAEDDDENAGAMVIDGVIESALTQQPTEERESSEEPITDMIIRFTVEDRAIAEQGQDTFSAENATPAEPKQKPTVSQMVAKVKLLLVTYVTLGLEAIGEYLLENVFDGNYKKALSKDPYKGTSLNDLVRHKEMPLSRQRIAECIRVAALTLELAALGLYLDFLTYFHKAEIARLRTQEARVELAKEVHEKALTVQEVRERVRKLTGKNISADKRMAHAVIKQLSVLAHLTVDEETREFLLDKERLRAALSTGETAKMLDNSEKFRDALGDSAELLHHLEKSLVEIVVERRQEDESVPENDPATTSV